MRGAQLPWCLKIKGRKFRWSCECDLWKSWDYSLLCKEVSTEQHSTWTWNESYNVTRDQAFSCQGVRLRITQCGPVTRLQWPDRRCSWMHTQGPTQVNTLSFQLFSFMVHPKDLEVLKATQVFATMALGRRDIRMTHRVWRWPWTVCWCGTSCRVQEPTWG